MNDRIHEGFYPPPKTIFDHGRASFAKPERLNLINQGSAEYSESFCRGFSLAASKTHRQSIIGLSGLPLILLHAAVPKEGYRIAIRSGNISVEASTPGSFQYAGTTLGQLLEKHPGEIPEHTIEDEPSFPVRGVMLDISRGKVPTMKTLFELVDLLASWKINHLQLYTEHTFAYSQHKAIWRKASPITAEEVLRLDDYCNMLNIELVPNQNSFGHLRRWLEHPDYAHLAETPDGYTTPWGEKRSAPFSLNPLSSESLEFLSGLYDELLPHFKSKLFNIGADETFDLGQGASKSACDEKGKGRVYLDFLNHIKQLVEQRGHKMLFWGDIVLNHPELISELDNNLIALVWGYEANHPFADECKHFAEADLPFWVCPGTSTWNSITGRLDNALANIDKAAHAGLDNGAEGFLITEWGDNGHWQTMPFSMIALAAGSYAAWHGEAPDKKLLNNLFTGADIAVDLGNFYQDAEFTMENKSPVFPLLRFQNPESTLSSWSTENIEACLVHIDALINRIRSSVLEGTNNTILHDEMLLGASMTRHALRRGHWLKKNRPTYETQALVEDMRYLINEFIRLWNARNRPGGMTESIEPLVMRLQEYESADQH